MGMSVAEKNYTTQLTSRQRDLLLLLLEANRPLQRSELAERLNLTNRQLNYDLKWVGENLAQDQASLNIMPRVGIEVRCTSEQRRQFIEKFSSAPRVQLVLSGKQRRQLLIFALLTAKNPITLEELQRKILASRSTVIKDLDQCEAWLVKQGVTLDRKPNFGFQCHAVEPLRRQVLTDMLWEGGLSADPLILVNHFHGLQLTLANDRGSLPIVNEVFTQLSKWQINKSLVWVSEAEKDLGGRFSDDAVLYLALAFAIQAERVQAGLLIDPRDDLLTWLRSLNIWQIAVRVGAQYEFRGSRKLTEAETAWICMYLLCAPRNEGWFYEVDVLGPFTHLVDEMMQLIAKTYSIERLSRDRMLREGLINHLVPACLRQRFGLHMLPLLPNTPLSADYANEIATARQMIALVHTRIGDQLPEHECNGFAQLMRAAYIREHYDEAQQVIVVCPSGMVTAQLLVARLKVYFPRLGNYRIVPLRELDAMLLGANQIVITTVSLPDHWIKHARVVQVHPMLLPADIERITHLMT